MEVIHKLERERTSRGSLWCTTAKVRTLVLFGQPLECKLTDMLERLCLGTY